jgi:hypothetical protein
VTKDDRFYEFGKAMNEQAMNNANIVLRSLLLINGGAAVALLAFVGSMVTSEALGLSDNIAELTAPFLWFGWGIVATVASMAFAYLTNYSIVGYSFAVDDGNPINGWNRAVFIFHVLAVFTTFVSLGCFIYGLWAVRTAVTALVP